jgi:phosphatidylglycerol---prolipoprotein diacylglyceryl transferase
MPTGFNIGPLFVHFYGIILMLGALAGAWLADREAKRRGLNSDLVWDALIWVLIGGIVGARLWHILTPPPSMVAQGITTEWYLRHPLDMLNTRMGGLGIPGAIIGGMIALYFFTRRRKTSFAVWADIAAPALALGQAIGRWGNYINQEVYGAPTNLPWAITIDPQHRLPEYQNIATYHPLFLYESLWNAANLILLLWLGRKYQHRLKPGDLFITYLLVYPLGRFLLEFLRLDSAQIAGINANQTVSLIVALAAGVALFLRHRPGQQAPESVPQPSKRPSKRAR